MKIHLLSCAVLLVLFSLAVPVGAQSFYFNFSGTSNNNYTNTNTNTNTNSSNFGGGYTYTQTCTQNGVPVDCITRQPLAGIDPAADLCPERVNEVIYGRKCDHVVSQIRYQAFQLQHAYGGGDFEGGTPLSGANGLNDNTDIAGAAQHRNGELHAVRFNIGASYFSDHYFTDLGIDGSISAAHAINNLGTVVGGGESASVITPVIWHSQIGLATPLPGLNNEAGIAVALARNRYYTEFVAGYSRNPSDGVDHGFLWRFDGTASLRRIGGWGEKNQANDVNDSQVVVGWIMRGGVKKAYRWKNAWLQTIGPAGVPSEALALNNNKAEKIAGWYRDNTITRAFVWQNGISTTLPALAGADFSIASAIADGGDIVGSSGERAVIWRNQQVYDLNGRLDNVIPSRLTAALKINRQGRILARSSDGFYILIPSEDIN